jgi:hypothetical protein
VNIILKKIDKLLILSQIPAVIGTIIMLVWRYNDARSFPLWIAQSLIIYEILCVAFVVILSRWFKRRGKQQENNDEQEESKKDDSNE